MRYRGPLVAPVRRPLTADGLLIVLHLVLGVTVADVTRLYATDKSSTDLRKRAISVPALSERRRGHFEHQLKKYA